MQGSAASRGLARNATMRHLCKIELPDCSGGGYRFCQSGAIKVELMLGIGLVSAVFVVLVLALLAGFWKFHAKAWVTKGLKRGDLHALKDVASGLRPDGLTPDQAGRLQSRGMVRAYGHGYFRATVKGRLALQIRQATRHREQH